MLPITTLQIREAFKAQILAIEPTFEPMRAVHWSHHPSPRKNGRSVLPAVLRNFDLVRSVATPSYLIYGGAGVAYKFRLAVATSYAGVNVEDLADIFTADHVDLRRELNKLRDPTLPGLIDVIDQGVTNESVDSQANVYVEHAFEVHYLQSTD